MAQPGHEEAGQSSRTDRKRGGLLGALRRLTSSDEELDSQERERDAVQSGAATVARCSDRQVVVLQGRVDAVTLNPVGAAKSLQVEFSDGSGVVSLVWMGRRQIPGIQAGTTLRVEGRISRHNGQCQMYNPRYELIQVPAS